MSPEEIENGFASAGWHLDGGFEDYLLIGYNDHGLSILAPKEAWWETDDDDDPVFELLDRERDLTYGVREIPTPESRPKRCSERTASRPRRRGTN